MSRQLFPCPGALPVAAAGSSIDYSIDVITPMFGGSAVPRQVDPEHPVRVSEIRGNLRFWWRATRGAACVDETDLHKKEGGIWGTTKEASPVSIDLLRTKPGRGCRVEENGYPRYALFPFSGDQQQDAADGRRDVSFELRVGCPDSLEKDVQAAVWAWVNFGGIGARTRRGAGALFCAQEAPPNRDGVTAWLKAKMDEFGLVAGPSRVKLWPVLALSPGYRPRLSHAHQDSMQAWRDAADAMAVFRQGVGIGRNPGTGKKHGRSLWPEADSIRALTGNGEPSHLTSQTLPHPIADPAFPRADLGMPIVLKFLRDDIEDAKNNCEITPLDPRGIASKRMASPIILRPLKLQDRSFCGMVLRLYSAPASGVSVSILPGRDFDKAALRRPDLAKYPSSHPKSPMAGLTSTGSSVAAFLKFAEGRGFEEVA